MITIIPTLPPRFSRAWPLYLFVLCLPAVLFAFLYGLRISPDGPIHMLRIARLHEAIQHGILFPRWISSQLIGYGYPTLNYYASASYYVVEAFQLSGLSLYWAFAVAQSLFVVLAAFGAFLFARDLMGKEHFWPAMVAAVAYGYGPYFLHNFYVRGAIAEQGAQMLFPWVLWSFRRIWRGPLPQHYVVSAALLLAALAFTHTISLLLFPPILTGYILILLWDTKPRAARLGWTGVALGGAMAISCFYWLPLIVERGYVSALAYSIAQNRLLPQGFMEAENFLDPALPYVQTKEIVKFLTIPQVIGVAAGLPFVVRRWQGGQGKEWVYWVGVLLLAVVMMTELTLPIWLSHEIFAIIQFPFRLLGLVHLPVALLTALPFLYIKPRALRATGALLAIAMLIWAYWPRLPWVQTMSPATSFFNMPMNLAFEVDVKQIVDGGMIVTSLQEFRPRWVSSTLELDPATVDAAPLPSEVTPLAANPLHLRLRTSAAAAFPLRLHNFYFPGWQITLEDGTRLTPYPSTSLGLLTAEIPAGEHVVDVRWTGTGTAFWAALISQIALLLFIVWQATQPRRRLWALALTPLLLLALVASYWPAPLTAVTGATSEDRIPGVHLAGYGQPAVSDDGITVYPYWFALETSPPELVVRWELHNAAGEPVAQTDTTPFYDYYTAKKWPAGTLVDDAQYIPLPDGLPAGTYDIVMQPLDATGATPLFAMSMGSVTIATPTVRDTPAHPLELYLGDDIALKGYDVRVVERLGLGNVFLQHAPEVAVVRPQENLVYELYWQLLRETDEPYSGFIHLTDHVGAPLVQADQSPGPIFAPVSIWGTGRLYQDHYMLTIPRNAASGLYWPHVGMYNWRDLDRFPIRGGDGELVGDHAQLPPVKVLNRAVKPVGIAVGAQFGEMAELVRYDVHTEAGQDITSPVVVRAGSAFTITAYYRVAQPSSIALTRFIQLRDDANQIVAQMDSEPQAGQNPTWAWMPGEIVQDRAVLSIPAQSAPGEYLVYLGFYEPAGNYPRVPVTNSDGLRAAHDELRLPAGANPLLVQVVK